MEQCTYAARTILESSSTLGSPTQVAYSPAFPGSIILHWTIARALISKERWNSCRKQAPTWKILNTMTRIAGRQTIRLFKKQARTGYMVLPPPTESDGVACYQHQGYQNTHKRRTSSDRYDGWRTFIQEMMGQRVWHPNDEEYQQMGFGGHAMCVIGYDDRVEGGAFQIMNSWGPEWGRTVLLMFYHHHHRYADFAEFVREARLDPLPKRALHLTWLFNTTSGCGIGNKTEYSFAVKRRQCIQNDQSHTEGKQVQNRIEECGRMLCIHIYPWCTGKEFCAVSLQTDPLTLLLVSSAIAFSRGKNRSRPTASVTKNIWP